MEEDLAREYTKNSGHKMEGFLSRVSPFHIIIFGVIIFVIIAMSNNPNLNKNYNYVIYGVLVTIILVLYFKPDKEKKLLPEHVVKQIAQEALNRKLREGKEFAFDSKVLVMPACHLVYENDLINGTSGPISWEIGFVEKVRGTQYGKEGVIRIHPYLGLVCGISFYPAGYTGKESRDRTIIGVGVVQGNVKTTDLGTNPKV